MKIDLLVDIRNDPDSPPATSRLPTIERCLARGEAVAVDASSFTDCLLCDFGISADDAPFAAIALAGEGDDPSHHYWLRADPVSLQATIHRLTGGALPDGELDWSEARARADVLAPHLRDDDCELIVKHPQRWYVRCASPQQVRTVAPPRDNALLEEAMMPGGPDGPSWQRLMTEAQMLFHSAEVDRDREAQGRRPVNGIWIWGGGLAPHIEQQPYGMVYSDDVLALGLGRLSSTTTSPLPKNARTLATGAPNDPSANVLIAISSASLADMHALETQWVAPLVSLVSADRTSELRLRVFRSSGVFGCTVTHALMRRWWRRARPL